MNKYILEDAICVKVGERFVRVLNTLNLNIFKPILEHCMCMRMLTFKVCRNNHLNCRKPKESGRNDAGMEPVCAWKSLDLDFFVGFWCFWMLFDPCLRNMLFCDEFWQVILSLS